MKRTPESLLKAYEAVIDRNVPGLQNRMVSHFNGKRSNSEFMNRASFGARREMSESGWSNGDLLKKWSNGDLLKKYLQEHRYFLPHFPYSSIHGCLSALAHFIHVTTKYVSIKFCQNLSSCGQILWKLLLSSVPSGIERKMYVAKPVSEKDVRMNWI